MSEFRTDPLFGSLSLIARERAARPHRSRVREEVDPTAGPCPLCPGNEALCPPETARIEDTRNPGSWASRSFPNRYPAVSLEAGADLAEAAAEREDVPLSRPPGGEPAPGFGVHELVVDSPSHSFPFWMLSHDEAVSLVGLLRSRIRNLHQDKRIAYLQVFKNHRASAGGSLDHPHFQLIGLPFVPERVLSLTRGGRCRVCELLRSEVPDPEKPREAPRFIAETTHFVALADYAPAFSYQFSIYPKIHAPAFEEMTDGQAEELHSLLGLVISRLERILGEVPLNLLLYNRPSPEAFRLQGRNRELSSLSHWFLRVMPRMGRHAGFELSAGVHMIHAAPEDAAERLREKAR
jgi:UDPglucose--hexose-1-phosphate uridylyltransferase